MYGRYEYKDDRSDKFWSIKQLPNGNALAEWGKNGYSPQGSKEYQQHEVRKKLNEKIAKGYRLKDAWTEQGAAELRVKAKREVAKEVAGFMDLLKKI